MRSKYMAHSTTDDVLEIFQNGISEVDKSKVMQVLSDRLVFFNVAFMKKSASVQAEKEIDSFVDLGTCRLLVVQGSIKAGA